MVAWVSNGGLQTQALDPVSLQPTGPVVTIEGGVLGNDGQAVTPALSLSETGVLLYRRLRRDGRRGWRGSISPAASWARSKRRRCAAIRSSRPGATASRSSAPTAPPGRRDIWLLGEREPPIRLTDAPGGASDPVWSPDGQTVAFSSNPRGIRDLFARQWATSGEPTPIYGSPSTKYPCSWSRDGSLLAFTERGMGRGWNIWALTVATGEAPAARRRRLRRHRAAVLARPPPARVHLEPQRALGGLRAGSAGAGHRAAHGVGRPRRIGSALEPVGRHALLPVRRPAAARRPGGRAERPSRSSARRGRCSARRRSARSASACASTTPSTRTGAGC